MEWNIQSRSHGCQACHRAFGDKEAFHTLLFDHKSGYERQDVCEQCWTAQHGQGATDRKGFISHWQSVYTPPPATAPDAIQKETAETLLRKLVFQNDPSHEAARFILAVMLERKRIFKVKAQLSHEGRRIFVYEHVKSGDLFNIADPHLQLDQLEEVQRDIGNLLEKGLPDPSAQPQPAPVASEPAPASPEAPVLAVAEGTA